MIGIALGGGGIPIGPDDMNKENIGVLGGTPLFKTLDEDYETQVKGFCQSLYHYYFVV